LAGNIAIYASLDRWWRGAPPVSIATGRRMIVVAGTVGLIAIDVLRRARATPDPAVSGAFESHGQLEFDKLSVLK
jgi:hypothetical protein